MARRSGRGKTPDPLVKLIKNLVEKSSQNAVSKELGIAVGTINRLVHGVGEPTQETMEKLALFFEVSTAYLRGEFEPDPTFYFGPWGKILESYQSIMNEAINNFDEIVKSDISLKNSIYVIKQINELPEHICDNFNHTQLKIAKETAIELNNKIKATDQRVAFQ